MFSQNIVQESPIGSSLGRAFIVRKAGKITSLKHDPAAGMLYFTDDINGLLKSYDLETRELRVLYRDLGSPDNLSIDPNSGLVLL